MKIETNAALRDLRGEPLREFDVQAFGAELLKAGVDKEALDKAYAATRKDITFEGVAVNALMASYDDEKIGGTEKLKRFRLAQKISGAAEAVDLDHDERELVRSVVNKAFGTLVYGRICELTEEPAAPAKKGQ